MTICLTRRKTNIIEVKKAIKFDENNNLQKVIQICLLALENNKIAFKNLKVKK